MSTALQIRDLSPMAYALTRIGAKLMGAQTASIFSPGQALQPTVADPAQAGPRQYQYPVAVNQNRLPRRDFSLTPFETLRALCNQHPVAALCIRVRTEQVADIAGTVIARRKKEQGSLQRDCDDLDGLFMMPDGQTPRSAWLKMLVRDLMEIDAPTVYKRPRVDGGISGLEVVDGATIKPVIDLAGRTAGYQQILYGLALSQYLERPARPGEEWLVGEYSPGELWYQPYWATTTSPYGKPPMEDMIRLAEIAISKQKFDLAHFTDGNIPAALAVFDEKAGMNPDQVFSFEQDFNADMQSNPARVGYMKFIPFPVRVERLKELTTGGQYESAAEEGNIKLTCAFFGVLPSEIGFTADVNKATSEGQENITYRRGIKPLLSWLKTTLFDPTIQRDMGRPDLEWAWDYGESEDRLREAQIDGIYQPMGVVSGAELRTMRYPDLEGPPPAPPTPPAVPGSPPEAMKLLAVAKVADGPPDATERLQAEGRLTRLLSAFFGGQLDRLRRWLANKAEQGAAALSGFFEGEVPALIRALLPFYDSTLTAAIARGEGQIAVSLAWDQVNEAVLKLARAEATALAAEVTRTTQAQAAQMIADWIATGGTMPELTERLEMLYPAARAEMIGTTEVTRLYAKGNIAAWKASEIVTGYTWETSADERVCPVCGPRQGETYGLDSGEMPPAHPRCRCWIVPSVE